MSGLVSADTDDLDIFVEHGQGLQLSLSGTAETLGRQRNYLLGAGLPQVVEASEIPTLDNTLLHMADLDRFVEDISTTLKAFGEDLGQGVFKVGSSRIEARLEAKDDKRLDDIEAALEAEGLSEEHAEEIRSQLEVLLETNPRFELNGATIDEPGELATAIVQNIEARADELIDNNKVTSSTLHAQPSLSVQQLAADLHYGNNNDPLVPEELLLEQLDAKLTDRQNEKLGEELAELEYRESAAVFSLIADATEPPLIDNDFDSLASDAHELYQDNLSGPGMYGTGPRLDEASIAYELQKMAEEDPGRAIGIKLMLDGLMDPDERTDLDRALAGDAPMGDRIDQAIQHPRDGIEGAGKGFWNSTFGWAADELADAQVAITHGFFGMATGSNPTLSPEVRQALPQAPTTWDELDAIVELELEYDNIAEQGGDDIALIIDLGTAAYGGAKGGFTLVRVGRRFFLRHRGRIVAGVTRPPFNAQGRLPRSGNRIMHVQPQGSVTCVPHSCAMSLDTLGHPVDDLPAFVERFNVGETGMSFAQARRDLRRMGITARTRRFNIDDLAARTSSGQPVIMTVDNFDGTTHAVVVDGVTTRYGRRVVALRDPLGAQYFEDVETFRARSLRWGLTIEG